MRLVFGPDDEDAFFAARDDLVSRFEQHPGGNGLGWVASQVLEFKWGYLDGDLTRWTVEDIMEILLGLYPAKVMLDPEDLDAVVTGFAGFVRFMAGGGLIPGAKADELATAINAMAGEFRIAALDEDNWSMGKRLWGQAQSEGIDIADNEAVQRFMDDFN
ncbi:MAG: hypothetical protein WEF28_13580, partial [Acidimicrobiia bacterium]